MTTTHDGRLAGLAVPVWRKASRSNNNGTQCVEVGAAWRTSTRSTNNGAECVEVGPLLDSSGLIAVRDSTDRDGGTLLGTHTDWTALIHTVA